MYKTLLVSLFFFCLLCSCSARMSANVDKKDKRYHVHKKARPYQATKKSKGPLIAIDPGHGGIDLGAHSHLYEEKQIALKVSLLLRKYLEKRGYRTVLTRTKDEYVPLQQRANIANELKCFALISMHCNTAKSTQAHGIEIFYTKKTDPWRSDKSKQMAQVILSELIYQTKAKSRGVKEANFLVIRETKMPAILIETGFLTNEKELNKLKDDGYLETIAKSIAQGADFYFRLLSP